MGILQCRYFCQIKEIEEKLDIINYNYNNNNKNPERTTKKNNYILNDTNIETPFSNQNNDENYISFKKIFEEKLPLIGKYISFSEFEYLIPEYAKHYITENILDISKYLIPEIKTYEMKPVEFIGGNIYRGNWNEKGEMQGYGLYYLKNDKVFVEGIWKGGSLIFGRIFLPNGDLYEGGIKNSNFNGFGKLYTNDGEIYEGYFIDGEKNGFCNYLFPDGTIYNGYIINGFFNGEGNMKWNNGIKYEGNFLHSSLTGFGTLTNLEGDKYEGLFDNNNINGKGKYYFDNRDIYEGNFEDGRRKGKGIYKRNDGFVYNGEWENDLMNGLGKIIFKNFCIHCIYKRGEICNIEIYNHFNKKDERNYDYFYNIIREFEPEETGFYKMTLEHLEYNNNIISQYGPEIMPSFMNDG